MNVPKVEDFSNHYGKRRNVSYAAKEKKNIYIILTTVNLSSANAYILPFSWSYAKLWHLVKS